MGNGELFVMTSGIAMMPVWCADSWDLQPMVSPLTHQTDLCCWPLINMHLQLATSKESGEVIRLTFIATSFSSKLQCCASTWHQPGWVHAEPLQTFQSSPQLKYNDGVHY